MLQLMMDATGEEKGDVEEDDKCLEPEITEDLQEDSNAHPLCKKTLHKLTNEQIVAEAVGLMMAGYDTTANALSYTSYLLALNPDIQEKLQSEIDGYFDDRPVCVWLEYECC